MRGSNGAGGCFGALMLAVFAVGSFAAISASAAPNSAPIKRVCKQRIEWTALGQSRALAQRNAIDGWSAAAAGQHGDGFTKWAIAGVARVSCALVLEGHRCRAAASPCRDLTEPAAAPPR